MFTTWPGRAANGRQIRGAMPRLRTSWRADRKAAYSMWPFVVTPRVSDAPRATFTRLRSQPWRRTSEATRSLADARQQLADGHVDDAPRAVGGAQGDAAGVLGAERADARCAGALRAPAQRVQHRVGPLGRDGEHHLALVGQRQRV